MRIIKPEACGCRCLDSFTGLVMVRLLVWLILVLMFIGSAYGQEDVRIGVLANRGYEITINRWQPLADYLNAQLKKYHFSIVPLLFDETSLAVRDHKVDFVLVNSGFYIILEREHGTSRIVTMQNQVAGGEILSEFGGVIFTRSERSDIQNLNNLQGMRFAAVDERSFGGWQMAFQELRRNDIAPMQDFQELLFTGSHDEVVYAVSEGRVDAGTVRTDTLEKMHIEGKIRLDDFKVINSKSHPGFPLLISTELYPEWPMAKVRKTSDQLANDVAVALISMPFDSETSRKSGIAGWTTPHDYTSVELALRELGAGYYTVDAEPTVQFTEEERAWIDSHPVIRVHNEMNWQPFNFNKGGKPLGYSIDYMNLVAAKIGLEIEYVSGPSWDEFMQMVRDGSIDVMLNIVSTEDRRKTLDYTSPYFEAVAGIYTVRGLEGVQSLNDLSGMRVAVPKGFFFEEQLTRFYPDIKLVLLEDSQKCLEAVAFGQADATVGEIGVLNYLINRYFMSNVKLVHQVVDRRLTSIMGMAVNKRQVILRDILQKGLNAVSPTEVQALNRKWRLVVSKEEPAAFTEEDKNYLASLDEIKMCVDPDWMPIEGTDREGRHVGIVAEIMNLVRDILPVPIRLIKTSSWSESLALVRAKRCDILPAAVESEERRRFLNYSDPYLYLPIVVATTSDKQFIYSIDELEGRKLGVVRDYAIKSVLHNAYPEFHLVEVGSVAEGLERVYDGQLYGFADTLAVIVHNIEAHGAIDVKISSKLDEKLAVAVGVRNDWPQLSLILNKALSLIGDKVIHEIYQEKVAVQMVEGFTLEGVVERYKYWFIVLLVVVVAAVTRFFYQARLHELTKREKASLEETVRLRNKELETARELEQVNHQLVEASQEILEREEMSRSLLEATGEGIFGIDAAGIATFVNPAAKVLLGYSSEELLGNPIHTIVHHSRSDGTPYPNEMCPMTRAVHEETEIRVDNEYLWRKDGTCFPVTYSSTPVYRKGVIAGAVIAFTDITEMERLSVTDQLTGIFNRKKLDRVMDETVRKFIRYGTPLSVILSDIDKFKDVNDTYGHQVGDDVLKRVVELINEKIRDTDTFGRWGGEEFLIICPETDLENAVMLAERLRLHVGEAIFPIVGHKTASFGVATFRDGDIVEDIIKRADDALYRAKVNGRNLVEEEDD